MKPMERLAGVVAAGFLLLLGIYLNFGYHIWPLGDRTLLASWGLILAALVILIREAGLYIWRLLDDPKDKKEEKEDGRTDETVDR